MRRLLCECRIEYRPEQWGQNHHVIHCPLHAAAEEMYEALKEIAKGEGTFSLDQLTFACNVIERSKALALEALGKAEGKP